MTNGAIKTINLTLIQRRKLSKNGAYAEKHFYNNSVD
jgi:hypothetical protein